MKIKIDNEQREVLRELCEKEYWELWNWLYPDGNPGAMPLKERAAAQNLPYSVAVLLDEKLENLGCLCEILEESYDNCK